MGARSHWRADAGCDAPQEGEAGVRRQRPVRLSASRRQAPRGTGAGRAGNFGADSAVAEDRQVAQEDRRTVKPAEDSDPPRFTVETRIRCPAPEGGVTWTSTGSFNTSKPSGTRWRRQKHHLRTRRRSRVRLWHRLRHNLPVKGKAMGSDRYLSFLPIILNWIQQTHDAHARSAEHTSE